MGRTVRFTVLASAHFSFMKARYAAATTALKTLRSAETDLASSTIV